MSVDPHMVRLSPCFWNAGEREPQARESPASGVKYATREAPWTRKESL
jgi:hypothetical protein